MKKIEIISTFLKKELYGVLGTTDKNIPKSRIFQYLFTVNEKIYFGTTNNKPVYEQIQKNQNVCFCCHTLDYFSFITIEGAAKFENNLILKQKAMNDYPAIKELYKSPQNPIFEIFYIELENVSIFSINSGKKILIEGGKDVNSF